MKCSKCGTENDAGSKFCARCGSQFEIEFDSSKYSARESKNRVARIIQVFAVLIYSLGAVWGFVVGNSVGNVTTYFYSGYHSNSFSFQSALIVWIAAFVSGTMMLGFAEIIRLLQEIADK